MTERESDSEIDYRRLAKEMAKAQQQADEVKKNLEFGQGVAFVAMMACGVLAGLWTGRWWIGLLASLGSLTGSLIPGLNRVLTLPFVGMCAFFAWMTVAILWPSSPVIARVGITAVASLLAAAGYTDLVSLTQVEANRSLVDVEDLKQ